MFRVPSTCALLFLVTVSPGWLFAQEMPQTPYYPLAVGNTWEYYTAASAGGDSKKSGYTLEVTKFEEVDGVMCARIEMSRAGKNIGFEHISVTEDGIYRNSFAGTKPEKPVRFFMLPPKKGASWEVETKALGEPLKGTFTMEEAKVTIKGKEYDTFSSKSENLDASGLKFTTTYYFAKDVGLVKQVIEVGKQTTIIELEKFTPAKK